MNVKATRAAEQSADAARLAATAALAGLDRPWLFLQELTYNHKQWTSHQDDLIVKFRVSNHGNAPARIFMVKIVFFLGEDPYRKIPGFTASSMPDVAKDFPEPAQLAQFKLRWGRPPLVESYAEKQDPDFSDFRPRYLQQNESRTNAIIGSKEKSEFFYSQAARRIVQRDYISPEILLEKFLLVTIIYATSRGESEALNLCYIGNRSGHFDEYRGKPYNELKKLQLLAAEDV